jgi:two-component system KDP operon response regulator KdpE
MTTKSKDTSPLGPDQTTDDDIPDYTEQPEQLPRVLRQRRHEFMRGMIDEVGRYITSILDLDTLLWEVTRYTREVFNAYGTAVGLAEGNEVVLRLGAGQDGQHDILRIPIDDPRIPARVVNEGIGLIVESLDRDAVQKLPKALADARSQIAVPIVTYNDRIIGVLVAYADEPNAYDSEHLQMMDMLAEHVSGAVTNARLLAKQQVETWGSAVLLRVARMLSGMRNQEELIYAVLGLALDLTGAEHGVLLTFRDGGESPTQRQVYASNQQVNDTIERMGTEWQQALLNRLAQQEQLQISYAHYAAEELEPLMAELNLDVAMLAPIRVEDTTWGTLVLGYASAHRFTRYDFNLIAGLAAQAAAAIENARLLKQVEDEQSYLQAVIANTREGLFLVDPDGKVTYCNSRLEELIGVRYKDMMGAPYEAMFREIAALSDSGAETQGQLENALDHLNQQPTVHLMTAYPLVYQLQVGLFPILDDQMHAIGWGGIVRDVTAEWNEITQRTEHLSSVTHEIRTGLAKQKGFITTLLSSHRYWGDREREEFLQNLDESVDQLSQMLENAQEMTRLEAGTTKLDPRPTDIPPFMQRVMQHPGIHPRADRFTMHIEDNLPAPEIDGRRIEQVLHNLMNISLEYAPGDSKIQIKVNRSDEDDVLFSVTTRGGIPEEHLTHIFDRFYQNDYSDNDLMKGPGLALYVARGLVLAHGGRIWAESMTGRGTTIYFTLPVAARLSTGDILARPPQVREKVISSPRAHTPAESAPTFRPPRQTLKALVVEDDPYMVRLLKINLETEGYTVVSATRGSTAIELANAEQPDIILLDLRLPDTNGFEVCARIREFNKAVPIIMITGKTTEDDIVRGLQLGADDYMVKPLSHKELLARMQSLLQRSWMTGETPAESIFTNGALAIDFAQRQVIAHNEPVKLTPTEYKLLYNLAINAGRVLTHEQLLLSVWGPGCEHQTQYLWVNISRLRGKLENDPNNPEYIMTEQGIGYKMAKM